MPGALATGVTSLKEKGLTLVELDIAYHPFFKEQPKLVTVPIPPEGRSLVVEIAEHNYYLLPFICR
eukprot:1969348-Ditylum_brightwellii.AAC.1